MIKSAVPAYDSTFSHTALSGAGELMLSSSLWLTSINARNNTSGFSALPGGRRADYGDFAPYADKAYFWSSTENSSNINNAYYRYVFDDSRIFRDDSRKQNGLSIRCLKD